MSVGFPHAAIAIRRLSAFRLNKDRVPFLRDADLRAEIHPYIAGVSKKLNCPPILVGGVEDHIHALVRQGRTTTQADWVEEAKRASNDWANKREVMLQVFAWQAGYGAFSVDPTRLGGVIQHIENQEEHHKQVSFKDEFIEMLTTAGLEWDERYIWD